MVTVIWGIEPGDYTMFFSMEMKAPNKITIKQMFESD